MKRKKIETHRYHTSLNLQVEIDGLHGQIERSQHRENYHDQPE
jgi:hypothetical protein